MRFGFASKLAVHGDICGRNGLLHNLQQQSAEPQVVGWTGPVRL